MYYSVDKIESGVASLVGDGLQTLQVPLNKLPPGTREGEMLELREWEFAVAPAETARRQQQTQLLLQALLNNEGG